MTNNTNTKPTVDHDVFTRTKLQLEAGLQVIAEIQKKIESKQNAQKIIKKETGSWEDYYAEKEIFVRNYVEYILRQNDDQMCECEYILRREGAHVFEQNQQETMKKKNAQ
jgi:hypothetical protein